MDTQFRSEQHGNVEVGIVTHEGRDYRARGAVVTDTHVYAYLGKDGVLTNWHGDTIGTYVITSTWSTPRSWFSSSMHQVYATIGGKVFTGRSAGVGMYFKGHVVRKAS
jgi:hypothetical protein